MVIFACGTTSRMAITLFIKFCKLLDVVIFESEKVWAHQSVLLRLIEFYGGSLARIDASLSVGSLYDNQ